MWGCTAVAQLLRVFGCSKVSLRQPGLQSDPVSGSFIEKTKCSSSAKVERNMSVRKEEATERVYPMP